MREKRVLRFAAISTSNSNESKSKNIRNNPAVVHPCQIRTSASKMSTPDRKDHIRVKRRNQTFFIPTAPSDSFAYIKEEICKALGGDDDSIDVKAMRLYVDNKSEGGDAEAGKETKKEIPDAALLSDHDVKNDDIIILEMDES
eukprot:scaffold10921_cov146-Skeletonema_dohrnii-CCMP3373.AAC.1